MTTQREWLTRWGNRFVNDFNDEVKRRQSLIAELRQAVAEATDVSEKDFYEAIIDTYKGVIEAIRTSHRQWQALAKRRWQIDVPDLTECLSE